MSIRARKPTAGRNVRKVNCLCSGGPFDGLSVPLTPEGGNVSTMMFSLPGYNKGELGRYVGTTGGVSWVKS